MSSTGAREFLHLPKKIGCLVVYSTINRCFSHFQICWGAKAPGALPPPGYAPGKGDSPYAAPQLAAIKTPTA